MRRRFWGVYLAALAAGLPVYFLITRGAAQRTLFYGYGLSAVAGIVVGIRWHRPERILPWAGFAVGLALFVAGDVAFDLYAVSGRQLPIPSIADVLYLAGYPVLAVALVLLVRPGIKGWQLASTIDGVMVALGVAVFAWVFIIGPYAKDKTLSLVAQIVAISYPALDLLLLAVLARLLLGLRVRSASYRLLAMSVIALLVADGLYAVASMHNTYANGSLIDLGWMVSYMVWGAAALHPSVSRLAHGPDVAAVGRTRSTLVVLTIAALAAPLMLIVDDLRGQDVDISLLASTSVIMFLLVLSRVSVLTQALDYALRRVQRGEARQRVLTEAAVAFMRADNANAVALAAVQSMVELSGHAEAWAAYVILTPSGLATTAAAGTGGPSGEATPQLVAAYELATQSTEPILTLPAPSDPASPSGWARLAVPVVVNAELRGVLCLGPMAHGSEDVAPALQLLCSQMGLALLTAEATEQRLEVELNRQALHDALTGLPNRALFIDRVDHALSLVDRAATPVAVLILDIDDFKTVNDSLGHPAGDELLVACGERLKTVIRPGDTVARLGGDEFAVLLESGDMPVLAEQIADRLSDALRAPFVIGGAEVPVQISVGIAVGQPRQDGANELLRDADLAMYMAKRNGRGRFELYQPAMHQEAILKLEMAADLRRALGTEQFEVFYQPIVSTDGGVATGAEALVRWRHPDRGLVSPAEFIPVAESTGLIVQIGRWVLAQSCQQAQSWRQAGIVDPDFYVSVNLSARQLQDAALIDDVNRELTTTGLPAELLVLEVTESTLMENFETAVARLEALRDLGIRLAVDDFGTGYSSLSYLRNLPVDVIKIDKSFIDRVAHDTAGAAMVRSVIEMARALNLTTVAEGVEDGRQLEALQGLGCDHVQGYLFAKPMPAREAVEAFARLPIGDLRP